MKKLTKKQRGFLKDYEATGNATEAAMRNYDVKSRDVANRIGSENLLKPGITAVLEKDVQKAEMDRQWIMEGTRELAEQREELSVALGAYKFVAQILKLIDANIDSDRSALQTCDGVRAEEARRVSEALTTILSTSGGRVALFVESGNIGIQPCNGESTQGDMPVHRNME